MQKRLVTRYAMKSTDAADENQKLVEGVFAELAAHFHDKVEFPPEATDGITDEQFLRNVADIVYRTRTNSRLEKFAA